MNWASQIIASSAASVAIVGLIIWVLRNWFLERLKGSIQHDYNKRIEEHKAQLQLSMSERVEALKSDLKNQETRFASDLKTKEAEISALREGALAGSVNRQGLLYRRTMEAVDNVWKDVGNLSPLKTISAYIAFTKVDNAAKEAAKNPTMRQMFETINKGAGDHRLYSAHNDRPYLGQLAWAYYSAYSAVLGTCYAISKGLESGIENVTTLIDFAKVKGVLKTALPHHATYIENSSGTTFFYLLDELEEKLLAELRKILTGEEADQASVAQAARIMNEVDKVKAEMQQSASQTN